MQRNKVGEQKFLKLFGHFSLVLLFSLSILNAKTFEDFKRSQTESFQEYKDERDSAFVKHLNQEWKAYLDDNEISQYEEKKPGLIIPAESQRVKSLGPKVSVKIKDIVTDTNTTNYDTDKDIKFDFYGTTLGFDIPSGVEKAKFFPTNQVGVTNFFNIVVSTHYEELLQEISVVSKSMNLNDWGVYLLVVIYFVYTQKYPFVFNNFFNIVVSTNY